MSCIKRGRYWAVTDSKGALVCLAVYRKGAQEVIRRLEMAARPEVPLMGGSDGYE